MVISCFVSYVASDSSWAEWVADVLRQSGHRVTTLATDFMPEDKYVQGMQEAAAECDLAIVILSENFLMSRFAAAERMTALAQDSSGRPRKLIPVVVDQVRPGGLWASLMRVEICDLPEEMARDEILRALAPTQVLGPAFPGARLPRPSTARAVGPRVDVWRLSSSPAQMVGRSAESETLTRGWLSGNYNVVTVIGWGGVGKTTLIANWLAEMAAYRYHDAEGVFAWSFDGQSDGENWVTSDQFFDALIRFLDVETATSSTTWERCREATKKLQQTRSLIVLDGLERVQHPPGPMEGTFRERVMQMFIREIAALNAGMLILTSRLPIIDIDAYMGKTCQSVPIPELSRAESIEILTRTGIQGDTAELSRIADEVRDHPLSLRLLSGYLQTVFNGDARMWESSGLARAIAGDGGNASAIMDQYAAWFDGRAELQLLQLLGLFNREAAEDELAVLRDRPTCAGLNDQLAAMSRADFAYAVSSLRRAGLIQNQSKRGRVDAHPLVREYFQRHFRERSPDAYREGHRRLRDLLAAKASERPRDLQACAPVLAAIWHGTRAGENADALDRLYWPRLAQEHHFLRDGLGAAASNHAVISYLLDETGGTALTAGQTSRLLAEQSLDLRMMGNTAEAIFPLVEAIRLTRTLGDPMVLINQLRHLSQLELALGKVDDACRHAGEALQVSTDQHASSIEILSSQTSCAFALLHAGRYAEAKQLLTAALIFGPEAAAELAPYGTRVTFCIAVYRTVDTLLSLLELPVSSSVSLGDLADLGGRALAVAKEAAERSPGELGLLGAALLELASERVRVQTDSRSAMPDRLTEAVENIREVGQRPWIIEANIVKCRALTGMNSTDQASGALRIAERLASDDGMALQELVCQIERARLDASRAGSPLNAAVVSDIITSARRLGLAFLAERAVGLGVVA